MNLGHGGMECRLLRSDTRPGVFTDDAADAAGEAPAGVGALHRLEFVTLQFGAGTKGSEHILDELLDTRVRGPGVKGHPVSAGEGVNHPRLQEIHLGPEFDPGTLHLGKHVHQPRGEHGKVITCGGGKVIHCTLQGREVGTPLLGELGDRVPVVDKRVDHRRHRGLERMGRVEAAPQTLGELLHRVGDVGQGVLKVVHRVPQLFHCGLEYVEFPHRIVNIAGESLGLLTQARENVVVIEQVEFAPKCIQLLA